LRRRILLQQNDRQVLTIDLLQDGSGIGSNTLHNETVDGSAPSQFIQARCAMYERRDVGEQHQMVRLFRCGLGACDDLGVDRIRKSVRKSDRSRCESAPESRPRPQSFTTPPVKCCASAGWRAPITGSSVAGSSSSTGSQDQSRCRRVRRRGAVVDSRTISSGRRTISMTGEFGSASLRSSNLAASVPI
jgi:hypothetical protein